MGIRAADLADIEALFPRLESVLDHANAVITRVYGGEALPMMEVFDRCKRWAEHMAPYVGPVEHIVYDAVEAGKTVLLEGAQGALLDLDHGTYPYVTSSHPTIGGAQTGLGLLPRQIKNVLGVIKAYSTRVGSGPFVTELAAEAAEEMRQRAQEFGTTTGRPRPGWVVRLRRGQVQRPGERVHLADPEQAGRAGRVRDDQGVQPLRVGRRGGLGLSGKRGRAGAVQPSVRGDAGLGRRDAGGHGARATPCRGAVLRKPAGGAGGPSVRHHLDRPSPRRDHRGAAGAVGLNRVGPARPTPAGRSRSGP